MQNFIKTDILTEAKSTFKLMKIDLQQSKCNGRQVNIGTGTSSLMIKVNESCKLHCRDNCLKFYIGVVSKLRKRCPFGYKLTRVITAQI